MKATRFRSPSRVFPLAAILLGAVLSVSHPVLASPGLIPPSYGRTAYVDFAGLPDRTATEGGLDAWQADNWARGNRCLQLVRSGACLDVVIEVPSGVTTAQLTLVHRSGAAPGCAGGGFAPVTVSVNGTVLAQDLAPQAVGGDGFSTDRWEIASCLTSGRNRIRVTAEDLCSVYEISRLELAMPAVASRWIDACQMTHDITNDRPTDNVAVFSPSDQWAICWTKVAPEAIGRPIEFRFYDPSAGLYFRTDRTAGRYNWGYINVAGWRAASLQGQWRVDVFVEGQFQLSVPFHIGSAWNGRAPRVTGVDFTSVIRANGEHASGYVSFHDPDGDITWVTFEAVDGFFADFEFDPNVGGQAGGRFSFYVYTWLSQRVTLKVTLHDRQGNESEPYWFSFNAR